MRRFSTICLTLSIVAATVLFSGCVRTLNPIFTSSDIVFEKALVGTWRQKGDDETWQFTASSDKAEHRAYRLVLTDDKGRPGAFRAHLVKLDDEMFLDLFPLGSAESGNGYHRFHFVPTHTFLHVTLDKDAGELHIAAMNPAWLGKYLKAHPKALKYAMLSPSGHKTGKQNGSAQRLVVTASTDELQDFLVKHVNTKGAFGDGATLYRIKSSK